MDTKVFAEVERYDPAKHVHVPLFNTERTKVLLLCLPGEQRQGDVDHLGVGPVDGGQPHETEGP